jgi:hypothetical protein
MMLSEEQRVMVERALSKAMWQAYCDGRIDLLLELAGNMKQLLATCR